MYIYMYLHIYIYIFVYIYIFMYISQGSGICGRSILSADIRILSNTHSDGTMQNDEKGGVCINIGGFIIL